MSTAGAECDGPEGRSMSTAGAECDGPEGRSMSTAGAEEEAEGRAGWGLTRRGLRVSACGEGGTPPSKPFGFLMLAALALPFVPTPQSR
ncbi:MAG: hypothetical protein PWR16_1698 [Methanoculleus sp.]|nr:hypothetical protein [Methanoculleus sp.]